MDIFLPALLGVLVLASLYAGPVLAMVTLVLALMTGRARPGVVLLALAGVMLCAVWIVLSALSGIRADETGTSASTYSEVGWDVAAVAACAASLVLNVRGRRRARPGSAPV